MEEIFEIKLTLEDIQIALAGLAKLPYEVSKPRIDNIVKQHSEILKEREEANKKSKETVTKE